MSGGKSTLCYQNQNKTKSVKCTEGWKLKPSIPIPETTPQTETKIIMAGYVEDCNTGQLDKYLCNEPGPNQVCYKKLDLKTGWEKQE